MSVARFALSAAAWAALVLMVPAAAPAASPGAGAPAKPPEALTVGTAPQVLTAAERAKIALAESERAARLARPAASSRLAVPIGPPAPGPEPAIETRIPATGPRDRTKPILGAREIALREKERAR